MDMNDDEAGKGQRAIQSVEVGGRLLLALAEYPAPMTLKDLAAKADLPPSRAHPYLVSYGRLGLVQQDGASGRYALGPAALQLGLAALHQCDPVRVAQPVADALAAETGQAVALAVWSNFGPTVIRMIDARQPLHVAMRAGTVMSVFGTATGRAFAGAMGPERVADAMAGAALGDPAARAGAGHADLDAQLASAHEELASHGCTRAVGRPIPGVNAFSAPAFDHDGEPAVVITLLGHQDHVAAGWSSPMAAAVKRAAAEVSSQLGYRPR
ncbi:IclR family transcriptional regulator [Ideonella sp.]|uniref:IclR family transcriptional regulator n=1 Tax=Ideonella sp. TaxID=1929293 RepID=UPI002B460904|nr:IclR family transcriptional regulator [Ideonella sp.]HJV67570.1 IclR family transcriptional regulator [Ideonella sp.]